MTIIEKGKWEFNETSGPFIDDAGHNNLTVAGSGPIYNQTGKIGKAVGMPNSQSSSYDDNYIGKSSGVTSDISGMPDLSIAFWFKAHSAPSAWTYPGVLLALEDAYNANPYYIQIMNSSTNSIRIFGEDSGGNMVFEAQGGNINDTNWHYIVITKKKSTANTDLKIYLDNSEVSSYITQNNNNANILSKSAYFTVGNTYSATQTNSVSLRGLVDDLRIFSEEISSNDVNLLYNSGNGTETDLASLRLSNPVLLNNLVSYYKFDGNANDSVGSNDVTVHGATLTTGKINQGYNFNGSSAYLQSTSQSFTGNADYTISAWIKTNVLNTYQVIFSNGIESTKAGLKFKINSNNTIGADLANVPGPSSSLTVTTGTWYFVTLTKSGDTYQIHINGNVDGTATITSSNISSSGTQRISKDVSSGTGYFNGIIDEVGIWNRVLTASEISELYNNGNGKSYPFTTPSGSNNNFFVLSLGAEF